MLKVPQHHGDMTFSMQKDTQKDTLDVSKHTRLPENACAARSIRDNIYRCSLAQNLNQACSPSFWPDHASTSQFSAQATTEVGLAIENLHPIKSTSRQPPLLCPRKRKKLTRGTDGAVFLTEQKPSKPLNP